MLLSNTFEWRLMYELLVYTRTHLCPISSMVNVPVGKYPYLCILKHNRFREMKETIKRLEDLKIKLNDCFDISCEVLDEMFFAITLKPNEEKIKDRNLIRTLLKLYSFPINMEKLK